MPYHWRECNVLVAADVDPDSGIPGFKYTPVSLHAAGRVDAPGAEQDAVVEVVS